jgi:hypothetical protein
VAATKKTSGDLNLLACVLEELGAPAKLTVAVAGPGRPAG